MGAYEVLNLVLKLFATSLDLTLGEALLPFVLQLVHVVDVQGFFPLDFAVWNANHFFKKSGFQPSTFTHGERP